MMQYISNTFVVLFWKKAAIKGRTYTILSGNLSFQISTWGTSGYGIPKGKTGMMINCAGFLERSRVNGPGVRAVLWVQGCFLRCPGCFNRSFWSFRKNHLVSVSEIAETVISLPGIDGITFSGGEPFCQALPLTKIGELVRKEGLSVVTFSGFPSDTLLSTRKRSWRALLGVTDLLVAGPYIRECTSGISLCGSTNQEEIYLSDRIPMKTLPDCNVRSVEYTISTQGEVTITGFPELNLFHHETGCI